MVVSVIDFLIAKEHKKPVQAKVIGRIIGTDGYMSPNRLKEIA